MTTKTEKIEIKVMGKTYKVEKQINETLKSMSEALKSHEVALLTWVHKDYTSSGKFSKNEVESFRKSLNEYCEQIPESDKILKRMQEIDDRLEKDIQERLKEKQKVQNKKEKE
tara:strand:+ start:1933 stop:2271 length:339 start_codon:yes stop_codon:yes gene_type:complete